MKKLYVQILDKELVKHKGETYFLRYVYYTRKRQRVGIPHRMELVNKDTSKIGASVIIHKDDYIDNLFSIDFGMTLLKLRLQGRENKVQELLDMREKIVYPIQKNKKHGIENINNYNSETVFYINDTFYISKDFVEIISDIVNTYTGNNYTIMDDVFYEEKKLNKLSHYFKTLILVRTNFVRFSTEEFNSCLEDYGVDVSESNLTELIQDIDDVLNDNCLNNKEKKKHIIKTIDRFMQTTYLESFNTFDGKFLIF